MYCGRHVRTQTLQQTQLLGREGVNLAVRSGEYPDQFTFQLERDRDFGANVRLARHVVRIEGYVRRVTHLPGDRHVSHQAVGSNSEAVAFAMHCATANARQFQF